MSVDTKGLIIGEISPEEVTNILIQKGYDEVEIRRKNKLDLGESRTCYSSVIMFNCCGNYKLLHVLYDTCQTDINQDIKGGEKINPALEYTQLFIEYDENSEEIMKDVVSEFGGYIDSDDCDNKGYKLVQMK